MLDSQPFFVSETEYVSTRPKSSELFINSPFATFKRVVPFHSNWMDHLIHRFDALMESPDDEFGGRNPKFIDSLFSVKLIDVLYQEGIPAPGLAVADDGTFLIEWHRKNYDLEIEILGCNNVIAERLNRISNTSECLEFKNDFSILFSWISDLKGEF